MKGQYHITVALDNFNRFTYQILLEEPSPYPGVRAYKQVSLIRGYDTEEAAYEAALNYLKEKGEIKDTHPQHLPRPNSPVSQ